MTTNQRDAITNSAIGNTIFNTTVGCLEIFLGVGAPGAGPTGWKNLCKANVDATFQAATLNCGGALAGDYVASVAMTAANIKTATVTVLTPGDYTATTDEVNGVKFSTDATISSVGAGAQIRLQASGTPLDPGTFTYTLIISGQSCTFNVTYASPPAPILNGQVNCSGSASGTYTTNNATTAAHSMSLTVTPTGIGYYNYTAGPVNGVTFAASGNFTAGDVNTVKTITLQASGAPVDSGNFNYTVSGTNITNACSFTVAVVQERQFATALINASSIAAGTIMSYSNVVSSPNGVVISGNTITLKAGKTYYVEANMRSVTNYIAYDFVNLSNSRIAGTTRGFAHPANQSSTPAAGFYTVGAADETIRIRVAITTGGAYMHSDAAGHSHVIIKEVNPSQGYLSANSPTNQNLGVAADFVWGTALSSNGGVTVSSSSITLKANKTYRLYAAIRGYTSIAGVAFSPYRFTNTSNVQLAGTSDGIILLNTNNSVPAMGIYTVGASDQVVKLRIAGGVGPLVSTDDANGGCVLIVEELPSSASAYLSASLVDGQTLATNANLNYNAPVASGGGLGVSGQDITLKAGKVYRISQSLRLNSAQYTGFTFANTSNVNISGVNFGFSMSPATTQSSFPASGFIRVGSTDQVIRFKATATPGGTMFSIPGSHSQLVIDEIN
jgi:hypothetical protein